MQGTWSFIWELNMQGTWKLILKLFADRPGKIYFGITIGVMNPTLSFTGKIMFGVIHIWYVGHVGLNVHVWSMTRLICTGTGKAIFIFDTYFKWSIVTKHKWNIWKIFSMIDYRIFAGMGVDLSENFATRLLRGKAWLDNGSSHWDRTTAVSNIC